jgi:hypothetical protein
MLKPLSHLAALILPALALTSGSALASDIGGAPVKAISTPTTYSTVYSATYYPSPFYGGHYGGPQTIIVTPVVPYNSITVTTGNTRLELITPAPYQSYGLTVPGYPNQVLLNQPGAVYQPPHSSHRFNHQRSCRSRIGHGHNRSIALSPGICW